MKALDLFCGAGGFSEGFRQAGFDVVKGIDNWEAAINTYTENGFDGVVDDIKDCNFNYFKKSVDVVIGSPPCQEWSQGKKDKRTFDMGYTKNLTIRNMWF